MADQNQNSQNQIPGTLRTLKTDLEMIKSNPQDRLQQAGNFVQVRPEPINTPTHTVSALDIDSDIKPQVTKQDIPEVNSTLKSKSNYSWSNMSTSNTQVNNAEFKPTTSQIPVENKSGFSVLDYNINLPLDNTNSINKGSSKTEFQPSASISNQSTGLTSKVEPSNQAPAFGTNSLNLRDDALDPSTKRSTKILFSAIIVVLLLSLIGGGLYFYFSISSNTTDTADNTDINIDDTEDNNDSEEQSSELISPLIQDSAVDIAFVDSEPIRRTIATVLTDKSDTLIQLNFIKDNNLVNLIDISDVLGITIPLIGTINDYGFYAYNQQGVYKLVAVLGLPEGQDAKTFVENWSNSIPRDMAGFSINLPSRIVNAPRINKSTITNNAGKTFENYYYNYTSPADSIDVSSYENYVLMASSQGSMKYILEEIR
ncbi:hypothetical protein EBU71_03740 [bacterium]|nr:hypothetical protein [Candidatus Elulimicrobium humile]